MIILRRAFLIGLSAVLVRLLAGPDPAASADLGRGAQEQLVEPAPQPSQWQFSFTPYGWMTSVNGNATAAGHTVDIDASFFDIVEKSDSIMALMGYFEARKGRFGFFTDVVWEDLSFDAHRDVSRNPFARLPNVHVAIKAKAQLDYQSTIIQSGIASRQMAGQRRCLHRLGRYGQRSLLEPGSRCFAQAYRHADG
jgi:hypothetical protein